ncbi:hypothetical protein [Aromatoleum diolicum]|uniref:Uncharacterized protein n=1 Tax=Aromatoleum diolicum TaxID=75796 RepID=A0ABX1QBG8_9RHOO|nr:hypothetical protein [Aromatoleum diolicum]NMG74732.1 hypothetical protein [Aromatoleum diolicum]
MSEAKIIEGPDDVLAPENVLSQEGVSAQGVVPPAENNPVQDEVPIQEGAPVREDLPVLEEVPAQERGSTQESLPTEESGRVPEGGSGEERTVESAAKLDMGFLALDGNRIPNLGVHVSWPGGEIRCRTDANGHLPSIIQAPADAELTICVQRFNQTYKEIGKCRMPASHGVLTICSPNFVLDTSTQKHDGTPGNAESRIPTAEAQDLGDLESIGEESKQTQAQSPQASDPASVPDAQSSAQQTAPKTAVVREQLPAMKEQVNRADARAKQASTKPPQNISGKTGAKPKLETGRDENGNPLAVVAQKTIDWWNSWRLPTFNLWGGPEGVTDGGTKPTTPVRVDAEMLAKVKALLEFAKEQTEYRYADKEGTVVVLDSMAKGAFKHQKGEKKARESLGLCYTYVKVALTRSKIVDGVLACKKVDSKQSDADHRAMQESASKAGPALIAKGFADVTREVPDARWAAAGDVIVYEWTDTTWETRKRNNPTKPNHGHIDIRDYEFYISDFISPEPLYRPNWIAYQNIRIYRKVYDLLPTLRIRAFLCCLREFECQAEREDSKRYQMLNRALPTTGSKRFSDYATHPWATVPEDLRGKATAAGAYQILYSTWKEIVDKKLIESGSFSPQDQDRIAVMKIEDRGVLHLIRAGKIQEALNYKTPRGVLSLPSEWTSLPGGSENENRRTADGKLMDVSYFSTLFDKYLEQEKQKAE